MLIRRIAATVAVVGLGVAAASAPGCSTPDGTTQSTSSSGSSGVGGGPATNPQGGGGSTSPASAGGAKPTSSSSAGGGGAAACGLCSAAFDPADPAPPASLCTDNGPPGKSSKDYFDNWTGCCHTNCDTLCNCEPVGVRAGQCSLCLNQCDPELADCGNCVSCSEFLQHSGAYDTLCGAGALPTSASIYQDFAACVCAHCPSDCGDSACSGLPASDACLDCFANSGQAVMDCGAKYDACLLDRLPKSG